MLNFFEDVTSRIDRVKHVDIVYLDCQQIVNKMLDKRLMHKIRNGEKHVNID